MLAGTIICCGSRFGGGVYPHLLLELSARSTTVDEGRTFSAVGQFRRRIPLTLTTQGRCAPMQPVVGIGILILENLLPYYVGKPGMFSLRSE